MRAVGRLCGACFRGMVWFMFWPLGWYLSHQAKKRRRHNALLRELRRPPVSVPQPGIYAPHAPFRPDARR